MGGKPGKQLYNQVRAEAMHSVDGQVLTLCPQAAFAMCVLDVA
jgi:hypothetical protein